MDFKLIPEGYDAVGSPFYC